MKRWRAAAVLAAVTLVTAGCGARVSSSMRQMAADAQLGLNANGQTQAGSGTGGSGTSGSSGNSGSASDSSGSAVNTGGQTGTATNNPSGAGANSSSNNGQNSGPSQGGGGTVTTTTAPSGGNGGATDVGVTANSITIGNVSDLSGPVPGLFQGAATGTLAFVNYINSQGGIYGRTLKLDSADSQTSCSQTESAYKSLIPKVFAFVGSFGLYDNCGANVLGQHTNVPALEYMLSKEGIALPNDYSVDPIPPGGYPYGMFTYYAHKFGTSVVQNVGTLYSNIPSAVAQSKGIMAAAESQGWKFTYQRAVGATETNFTADIVRMQSQGVKLVYIAGATAQICATVVQEAEQQNWHPLYVLPVAYASNFVQLTGGASAAEGIYGAQLYSLFFSASDAAHIPEVALYQSWMHRTAPKQPEDLYSMYGWAEGELFVQALRAAGPKATRAGLMAALKNITNFDSNGLVGPASPAAKVPTHCYILWQIHSGKFVRVDTPASSYRCDGGFYKG